MTKKKFLFNWGLADESFNKQLSGDLLLEYLKTWRLLVLPGELIGLLMHS